MQKSLQDGATCAATDTRRPLALASCPSCGRGPMRSFYESRDVPANSCILFKSEHEALHCPTSDIELRVCSDCGFIFNTAFSQERTEYSFRYEETQGFSSVFNAFHRAMAQQLIDRYDLHEKDILEVGCGKGEFLVLLAELGANRCVGIDPGVNAGRLPRPAQGSVSCISDFYSEKFSDHKVDFLACKMTLEHIPDPAPFVSTIRRGLGHQSDAVVFFQVPESLRILRECSFEDIYHEHCSYFTAGSLARLFRRSGFDIVKLDTEYANQYLTIEAKPAPTGAKNRPPLEIEEDLHEVLALVGTFPERMSRKLAKWRKLLGQAREAGQTIALWGSGSKAVTFLKTLDPDRYIRHVTDINPHRHDHYMPLSGQRIISPPALVGVQPDLVIAMNEIYADEIRGNLAQLGLAPELRCL